MSTPDGAASVPATRTSAGHEAHVPRITVEDAIAGEHLNRFYTLYLTSFGPLRTRAVARQVLHHHEFNEEMVDPRIAKYVAWDEHGEPEALATLTNHLNAVPWISPEYFAARYPEQWARKAVYYWGFVLVPRNQHRPFLFVELMNAVADKMAAERAVCAYDICAFNNATMRFGDQIARAVSRSHPVEFEVLDTQSYYGATFR